MTSKTTADFLLRMGPERKARLAKAADEEGTTIRDLVLYAIDQMLDTRDAEIAARERKQDLESRIERKFQEIMASMAGGDVTGLKAAAFARLQEKADAAISKWRDYVASHSYAEPPTPLEGLIKGYLDIEAEIEGARRVNTFGDEGLADPDDPDDGDEPEPADETWE